VFVDSMGQAQGSARGDRGNDDDDNRGNRA